MGVRLARRTVSPGPTLPAPRPFFAWSGNVDGQGPAAEISPVEHADALLGVGVGLHLDEVRPPHPQACRAELLTGA